MPKICFIGAGSTVFAKILLTDLLLKKELTDVSISLHDINAARLNITEKTIHKLLKQLSRKSS